MKETTIQVISRLLNIECVRFKLEFSAESRMGLQDNLIGNLSIKAVYKKKLPLFSFTGSLDPVRVDLSHDYIQMIQEVMPRSAVTYCDVDYMVCSGKETDEILESLKCGA